MRFVVYGAGAIGGLVGARLAQSGQPTVLIARGAHLEVLATRGLRLQSPEEDVTIRLGVLGGPHDIEWRPDDVVLLGVKSQDTRGALRALAACAPPQTPVVCLQNGVDNERQALRHFSRVYGVCVMCPAAHVEPGVVQAQSSPVTGLLDIGRYPSGVDQVADACARAFSDATFQSVPRPSIMRWKYTKLLMNLANAVEALCQPSKEARQLVQMARAEGEATLSAAGVDVASPEEDAARRGDLIQIRPVAGQPRGGGSSWQSLARSAGTIEADYLNGEIVLLGRLHGVPTPVNECLRQLANEAAAEGRPPASLTEADVLDRLASAPG